MSNNIVTISRENGSGGREIGAAVAERLGYKYYDQELVKEAVKQSGYAAEHFENYEEGAKNSLLYAISQSLSYSASGNVLTLESKVYLAQAEVIRNIAKEGSCVIVGRCADFILDGTPNLVKVFIMADEQSKIERIMKSHDFTEERAKQYIHEMDRQRRNYYNYHTTSKWGRSTNYNLCIDSGRGIQRAIDTICTYIGE